MHPTPENAPHPDRGVHWYRGDTCLPRKRAENFGFLLFSFVFLAFSRFRPHLRPVAEKNFPLSGVYGAFMQRFPDRRGLLFRPSGALDDVDEPLHPVGAFLLHLVRDVAVDVQREGRRGVAQVGLYGFDVVADLQGGHRVGMPHVVEADLRRADLFHDLLVEALQGVRIQRVEADQAYLGLDMVPDDGPIGLGRPLLDAEEVLRGPGIQPFPNGHLAGCAVDAPVNL